FGRRTMPEATRAIRTVRPGAARRARGAAIVIILGLGLGAAAGSAPNQAVKLAAAGGLGKIQHIVIIMQENPSFHSYFGTYPGADGIPMSGGVPTVCVPDPQAGVCIPPFHDSADLNQGGPHGAVSAAADINSGKMDGFVAQAEAAKNNCTNPNDPACGGHSTD